MTPNDVACVVLASGTSTRFGRDDKLQAMLNGQTVLSHVMETVEAVGFGQIYCVTQSDISPGCKVVPNTAPECGQGHALRLGLTAAFADEWAAVTVVLGDMPLVDALHLQTLIGRSDGARSVASCCEGVLMPPAVFTQTAMRILLSHPSATGAKPLFDRLDPLTVSLDPDSALDVDTPADLARVDAIMKSRST